MQRAELAKQIDHTLLGPAAMRDAVRQLCEEAIEYGLHGPVVSGIGSK